MQVWSHRFIKKNWEEQRQACETTEADLKPLLKPHGRRVKPLKPDE